MRTSGHAGSLRAGSLLNLYRDVWLQLKGRRRLFVSAVALLIAAQLVLLAIPYVSGRALNILQTRGSEGFGQAGLWLSMVLAIACASWALHGPGRILERRGALLVRQRMCASLTDRLFKLPLRWHEEHHSGATAHRVQQSTLALSNFAQSQFIYLNSGVRLFGPLIALGWLQPIVALAAAAGFALIIGSVVGFDRAMLKLADQENAAERAYLATLVDSLGNAHTVYALRQARGVRARLERRLLAVFAPLRRAIVLNELKWLTVDLASRLLTCGLIGLFVGLSLQHTDPSGKSAPPLLLGSLYMVWEYAQQAAAVVCSIASHFQTFARQHAEHASADPIRSSAPDPFQEAARPSSPAWQRLTLHHLSFHHAGGRDGPSLECFSLALERGKRYALIGASGSGKTTLMRVLAGLYPADRISLTCDAGPTHIGPLEAAHWLRQCATLVPQDAELFEGSLDENLGLCESLTGAPCAASYRSALDSACAGDFASLGTICRVAEGGVNWSGGQRSRFALARGILAAADSTLVLFDEPTANLDAATEATVYANLFTRFSNACMISSVHRLALLEHFDHIIVMQAGRIVAQGTLADLTLGSPEFQRLSMSHIDNKRGSTEYQEAGIVAKSRSA